jgi:thiamine pyrophosphate-dependent acetolactate synthase large subunit-like protein
VRTVADVLVETLVAFGITHVFGMVGHSNLGFADAMRRAEERGQLTYTGIRHEGAASFAASAYGKLTGRPAASFAIAGPGLPTCSPACMTPSSTSHRSWLSSARSPPRSSDEGPSRTST